MTAVFALDIGNSDVKAGLFLDGQSPELAWQTRISGTIGTNGTSQTLESDEALVNTLKQALLPAMERVNGQSVVLAYCSVVPRQEARLIPLLQAQLSLNAPPLAIRSGLLPAHLDLNGYPPEQLGADRYVNALATLQQAACQTPPHTFLIADFGTATTVDLVLVKPCGMAVFLGGAILPGLETFEGILGKRTAAIGLSPPYGVSQTPGSSTQASLAAGITLGYYGALQAVMNTFTETVLQEGYPSPVTLATGGLAERFMAFCPDNPLFERLDPAWTLQGLRVATLFF